jgi:hypothetical protein
MKTFSAHRLYTRNTFNQTQSYLNIFTILSDIQLQHITQINSTENCGSDGK